MAFGVNRQAGQLNRAKVALVLKLKQQRRTQPSVDASWKAFVAQLGGNEDPTAHSEEILTSFFESLEDQSKQVTASTSDADAEFDSLIAETVEAEEQTHQDVNGSFKQDWGASAAASVNRSEANEFDQHGGASAAAAVNHSRGSWQPKVIPKRVPPPAKLPGKQLLPVPPPPKAKLPVPQPPKLAQLYEQNAAKRRQTAQAHVQSAEETRLASDGGRYTFAEFLSHYGPNLGLKVWKRAGEEAAPEEAAPQEAAHQEAAPQEAAPQEASPGAADLEADWAKYIELMCDPDDSLVATGVEEVAQALAKGHAITVFFADGLSDPKIRNPEMNLRILESAGGRGYIVPRQSAVHSELTEYGGAVAVLRGEQDRHEKRRRVDAGPDAQMLLAASQPKAKPKAKVIHLRASLNSLNAPPKGSQDEATVDQLMLVAKPKGAPKVIAAKPGFAMTGPGWKPPPPALPVLPIPKGAPHRTLSTASAKAAPQSASQSWEDSAGEFDDEAWAEADTQKAWAEADTQKAWAEADTQKAASQSIDSLEDIFAAAVPKSKAAAKAPASAPDQLDDSSGAMVASAVPKALPPGLPPASPPDAAMDQAMAEEAPVETAPAPEPTAEELEEQKKQALLKEATNEMHRVKLMRELKSELKKLGTKSLLQDKRSIPKFAKVICEKYLEEIGEKHTFQVMADVFHKVKFVGHRKALIFVAHELLTNERRLNAMSEEKAIKYAVSLWSDFLMGISGSISSLPAQEHTIYEKILDLWTNRQALRSEDLATLRSKWTRR